MASTRDALWTVESDGTLYRTDTNGRWRRVGEVGAWADTIAMATFEGALWTITRDGTLYRTDEDVRRKVGRAGDWVGTRLIAAVPGDGLYTIEDDGRLYCTRPDGTWKPVGDEHTWSGTRLMVGLEGALFTLDRHGDLYRVDVRCGP
jgi:hypothetical protein